MPANVSRRSTPQTSTLNTRRILASAPRGLTVFSILLVVCAARLWADPSGGAPYSAEQSLERFRLAPGLEIQIAAAEPEVIDPVAVRFDEGGRMWVVEMRDYPHGPAAGEAPRSQIKVLEDRNGDGRFETHRVFADELLFVTGLQPWKGGAIVTLAGRVAYLKDTDGDGRADVNETWYTGFAEQNSQLRANHPRFGLDNQIYVANGLRGGAIVDPRRPNSKPVSISGKDFRFDPTTFGFEAITGVGQFGLTFDDFGNRFVCSNRNPLLQIVLEERYIQRNPSFAPSRAVHDVAAAGAESRVYPISRAWTTSNLHAGQFTAACGVFVFRGDALPKQFYGNGFTCDPTGNLVHREILRPAGAVFRSTAAREGIEFLASTDEWFRPVNLGGGPDGALYVVDMYRAVIEHPQWMPTELKTRPDLLLGTDRGRIYRIISSNADRRTSPPLDADDSKAWAAMVQHANGWHRDTAARVLYEQQDTTVTDQLTQTFRGGDLAASRVQALWVLDGLKRLNDDLLVVALGDPDPRIRRQALILAGGRLDQSTELRRAALALAEDSDVRVRFTLALVVAPVSDQVMVDTLAKMTRTGTEDAWFREAIAIASGDRAAAVLTAILRHSGRAGRPPHADEIALIGSLAGLAAQQSDPTALSAVQQLLELPGGSSHAVQRAGLLRVGQALRRRKSSLAQLIAGQPQRTVRTKLRPVFARAARIARTESATNRVQAVELLVHDQDAGPQLRTLALNESDRSVRLSAIAAVASLEFDAPFWNKMLAGYPSESPRIRRAILDAALARSATTTLALNAVAAGQIKPAELDRTHVNRLLQHPDSNLKQRAAKLFANLIPADREQVLTEYQVALELKPDPLRGRRVFEKNCTACHRIGQLGVNVAPDISDSRTKQPAQLLTDILQPNRAIDNNYVSYAVITQDGLSLTGIIANETATSITLRQLEGKTATLLRSDIELLRSNGVSLMPEGLEKNIPPQAMADLISFIKNWRYLDGRTPLGTTGSAATR